MKGIIFNLVEEVVTTAHGADAWDTVLSAAGLEGAYTSLGSYPDEDLTKLVVAASDALGLPPDEVVRTIGVGAMPLLADRYPSFFAGHSTTRSFLLTLNEIIHPEVRKLYPGASVPDFTFESSGADTLDLGYRSERRLCALAEGFVLGASAHFGETVDLSQPRCMLRGDESCLIHCVFSPA
ncbi:MAG TPA: heme NO-binding domain-containing protein [Acidimicrobiales bacterium]|nr:heme NO-binding domain-containing protein [Acidimicrobiales bacterium]